MVDRRGVVDGDVGLGHVELEAGKGEVVSTRASNAWRTWNFAFTIAQRDCYGKPACKRPTCRCAMRDCPASNTPYEYFRWRRERRAAAQCVTPAHPVISSLLSSRPRPRLQCLFQFTPSLLWHSPRMHMRPATTTTLTATAAPACPTQHASALR